MPVGASGFRKDRSAPLSSAGSKPSAESFEQVFLDSRPKRETYRAIRSAVRSRRSDLDSIRAAGQIFPVEASDSRTEKHEQRAVSESNAIAGGNAGSTSAIGGLHRLAPARF